MFCLLAFIFLYLHFTLVHYACHQPVIKSMAYSNYKGLVMNNALFFKPTHSVGSRLHWVVSAFVLVFGVFQAIVGHAQPAPNMGGAGEPGMGMHEMRDMHGMHPGPMNPARLEHMWQQHVERFEAHMAQMKKRLEITPAQEGAWSQFVAATRPAGNPEHTPMTPEQWQEMRQLKAPERLEKMLAQHEAHHALMTAKMHQHLDAVKALYAQLSEEQQKIFDKISMRPMGKRGGWHHR